MPPKHRKPPIPWETDAGEREQPKICSTSGKRMYASEAKATAAHQMSQRARDAARSGRPIGAAARPEQKDPASLQLRTYRCLYCDAWHLTSKGT